MTVLRPEPTIIEDERSKALLFNLIASHPAGAQFEFADMLRLWFHRDPGCLAKYLEWLDAQGLEIRKKR